jgi:hypothetical protein
LWRRGGGDGRCDRFGDQRLAARSEECKGDAEKRDAAGARA